MDKIKQAISRSKDEPEDALSPAGKIGGQGSHFASAKQPGDTHAGSDTLVSSTAAPGNAQDTAGPRVGGQSHLGTSAPVDHTPTAAGSTSTYSTTHLRQGDPTPSVVDSRSKDPLTYKKPEAQVHHEASEGSALTASSKSSGIDQVRGNEQAAQELRHGTERIPGAYPTGEVAQEPFQETGRTLGAYSGAEIVQESHQGTGRTTGTYYTAGYENPYKAQNLDPRVDNLPLRAKDETDHSAVSHSTGSTTAGTGGADLTTAGAANAISRQDDTQQSSATASSDQTSTGHPTYGSAKYSPAEKANFHENPSAAASSSNDATRQSEKSPSTLSKVLGAVGFSDIAGVGSGAAVKPDDRSTVGTSGAPLTTSGTDSSKSPSHSGSKEATAATAYPSDSDSAKPISLSTGDTRDANAKTHEDRHVGRDVAAGAGLAGAAGAGALGAHEYKKSSGYPEDTTRQPSSVPTSAGTATSFPAQQQEDRTHPVLGTSSHHATTIPASTTATRHEKSILEREEDDHSKRNVTRAGAVGIGAAGVGAYGAHELNERAAAKKAHEHGTESASQQKEIEKQQTARAKQAEKEEKAHHKDLEKQEKAAAKEHEKSEKKAIAAAAAVQKERLQEAKDKKGGQGDTLATAGVAGKDAGAYGPSKEDERRTSQDGEKKPGLLRRIFKRKNKDTGEEEEYEAEEEETDDSHHKGAATLGAAGVGAAGGGLVSHAASRDQETGASHLRSAEDRSIAQPSTAHSSTGYTTAEQPSTAQSSTDYASAQQPYTAQSSNAHSSTAQPHTQSSITHHPSALGAGVGAAGAGLAGYAIGQDKEIGPTQSSATYASTQPSTTHPSAQSSSAYPATTQSSTAYPSSAQATGQQHTTAYEDKTGGYSKPSYNPFTKDDPAGTRTTNTEYVVQPGQTGKTTPSEGRHGIGPASARGAVTTATGAGVGARTATPSDPSTLGANERSSAELDKHQRNRLHKDPPAGHPAAIAADKKAFNSGLPHDSSRYPEAAARQEDHEHHHHHDGLREGDEIEGEEYKGLREKIKEKLGLGHHDTHEER